MQALGIANGAATFTLGGITNQLPPGEVCAGAAPGEACNRGGGIGGAMGLAGTAVVRVIPMLVELAIGLEGIGEGGTKKQPWSYDFAGFTTGSAFVRTNDRSTPVQVTMVGGPALTADGGPGVALVSPTFLLVAASQVPVLTTIIVPVPEPNTLLLIGAGLGGLLLARRC